MHKKKILHGKAYEVSAIWSKYVLRGLNVKDFFCAKIVNFTFNPGDSKNLLFLCTRRKNYSVPPTTPTSLLTVRSCRIDFICSQAYR